jgi:MFS family permease
LTAYVTSAFAEHELTATTSIFASIIGGVLRLPIAKMIDLWGRAEGFATLVLITTVGLIMMAVCKNVETYAAAQVFYWVGYDGMAYILDVIVADTSSLKNRALMFSYTTSPYLLTTFTGSRAASAYYEHSSFRWAFGSFAIITPFVCAPFVITLFLEQRKNPANAPSEKQESGRTFYQSIIHYCVEFDRKFPRCHNSCNGSC